MLSSRPIGHRRGTILRYLFEYNTFFVLASFKLMRFFFENRFDVIQVNTMPDALVFTALVPKLFGAKVVLHMHEPTPELFGTMFKKWYGRYVIGMIKIAEKFSLMFADRVLTVTREMRDNFGRRGADVNKMTVIVNVPDEGLFPPRLYEHLREKVDDRVTHLGFVPFETMIEEILPADICVVPVKNNPYSNLVHTNKMYEYMALERPVIASWLDAVLSYFPEDSIVYFESGNSADLAEKIFHVFAHPEDIAGRMIKIRDVYDTCRWDREQRKYLGVFHSLLGE